jgi:hypothetical protein
MRVFAKLEVVPDHAPDDEPSVVERIVNSEVDVALWLRQRLSEVEQEHGSAWEADLHLEPLDGAEGG